MPGEEWEFHDGGCASIVPERLRWRTWAHDNKDGKALTGDELLDFVNNELFRGLRDLKARPERAALAGHPQVRLHRRQQLHEGRHPASPGGERHRRSRGLH
ncbi:MAG: hypothetical protein ACLTSX_09450 [Collinsella sp.]